jgi:large subunit ribosomal protein L5
MARLKESYIKNIAPKLQKDLALSNTMQVPKLSKIVVNMGLGEALANSKAFDNAVEQLTLITGQKPAVKRAKKSISNFKLRAGMAIGACVTLRRERMYEFLDRLMNIAMPRIRDFRGASPDGFDGRGNYTLGVKEQIIFPEIEYDKIDKIRGLAITFVTTARTDEEAYHLLSELGMPFRKKGQSG